jgi:membrane dipeptidase
MEPETARKRPVERGGAPASALLGRREFVAGLISAASAGAGLAFSGGDDVAAAVSKEVESLVQHAITGDTLVYTEDYTANLDPLTLQAIRASGMTYAFYDVSITPNGRSFDDCLRSVSQWNASVARNAAVVVRADCAADIIRAKKDGKHAMVYLFQDASPLERDLGRVQLFYDLGVRVIQLTHNSRNLVGDGYVDRVNGGLSDFGLEVVSAMNEARMLVDLSHCGDQTTLDAIRHSRRPCVFTHAGCREVLRSDRNKTDAEIRALAEKGGVIGIFNMTCWLTEEEQPALESVVAHIEHAVNVAGIDHVGFGSDGPMAGVQRLAEELAGHVQFAATRSVRTIYPKRPTHVRVPALNDARRLLVLADALSRRGYKSAEVEKIIGGNFFRLFREVVG